MRKEKDAERNWKNNHKMKLPEIKKGDIIEINVLKRLY